MSTHHSRDQHQMDNKMSHPLVSLFPSPSFSIFFLGNCRGAENRCQSFLFTIIVESCLRMTHSLNHLHSLQFRLYESGLLFFGVCNLPIKFLPLYWSEKSCSCATFFFSVDRVGVKFINLDGIYIFTKYTVAGNLKRMPPIYSSLRWQRWRRPWYRVGCR